MFVGGEQVGVDYLENRETLVEVSQGGVMEHQVQYLQTLQGDEGLLRTTQVGEH